MSTPGDVKTPTSAAMRAAERIEREVLYDPECFVPGAVINAEFAPLLQAADALAEAAEAYAVALRQVLYAGKPEVRESANSRLNQLGQAWTIALAAYRERRGA